MGICCRLAHFQGVSCRLLTLLLLGAAFATAASGSKAGTITLPAAESRERFVEVAITLCAAIGAWTWTNASLKLGEAAWQQAAEFLGGPFKHWRTGISGSVGGSPVRIRIESARSTVCYLGRGVISTGKARYFCVLTLTLPFRDMHSWRLLFRPDPVKSGTGHWCVVCETQPVLSHQLESFGMHEILREWSRHTVLKCDARKGELTLRYPVSHINGCPSAAEIEAEIQMLRRITALWQCALHTEIAA